MSVYSVDKLIAEARRLAAEYRRATGKTLPVSGEIALHDAIRLLELEAAPAGSVGFDAIRRLDGAEHRLQVKGRAIFNEHQAGHRIGALNLEQPWHKLVLVLMDENYEPTEIYEVDREDIEPALRGDAGSRRRSRGALSVARIRIVGRLAWTRDLGRVDDCCGSNDAAP